jgi:DNA-binding GntR family transcriptional regulator
VVTLAPLAPAASERIAAHLRDAILSGEIGPGERIRQEEVAERLGTSRLPVREALRMLEAEGLTEHTANKGARVPALDRHELDVLYQMRERLEPLALTESIPYLTNGQIRELEDLADRIAADTDLSEFLVLDRAFHLGSYAGCGTEHLLATVTRMWNSTQPYRRMFMTLGGPDRRWIVDHEHRLILDAIKRQDGVDAERFLSGHIRRTRIELDQHPELFGGAHRTGRPHVSGPTTTRRQS